MAILIVDDEPNTREALRNLLDKLGRRPLLEAKDGQEALKILDAEKSRIQMIIADWEMPYMDGLTLVKNVATRSVLDLAPFLLITSDLPKSRIEAFRKENPRLDSYLIKPFRLAKLAEALSEAHATRSAKRSTIIYIGVKHLESLSAVITQASPPRWQKVVAVQALEALQIAVQKNSGSLGTILIDPEVYVAMKSDWIGPFKKTPLGGATPVVCLDRRPQQIHSLRTQAQLFVEPPAGESEFWSQLLNQLECRLAGSWDVDHLQAQVRAALQQKDYESARELAEEMGRLDPANSEVQRVRGEVLEVCGDLKGATSHFWDSLSVNPCSPRVYIKLLNILASGNKTECERLAESAVQFCPGNSDVLMAAARALRSGSHAARAVALLHQVLAISPGHEAALAMLADEEKGD